MEACRWEAQWDPGKARSLNTYSAKKAKPAEVKLIANDKGNKLYQFINLGYKMVYIVCNFSKKLLWFGSCSKRVTNHLIVAFLYLMPMSFEIFSEQQRILQKIQAQMMNDSMGGSDMGAPQMRPF